MHCEETNGLSIIILWSVKLQSDIHEEWKLEALSLRVCRHNSPAVSRGSFSSDHEGVKESQKHLGILFKLCKVSFLLSAGYPQMWTGKDFPSPRNVYGIGK